MSTLVFDPIFTVGPSTFGLEIGALFGALDRQSWLAFERGELSEAAYFEAMFRDRRPVDMPAFIEAMVEQYAYLPGIEALLAELKTMNVEMHVLSNYPVWHRRIEDKLHLSDYLPWTFVSCEIGLRKPDPALYAHCAQALGREASELIFVDDQPHNIAGAEAAGWRGIQFRGAADLRLNLQRLGVLV